MNTARLAAVTLALLCSACAAPSTSSSSRWTSAKNTTETGERAPLSIPTGHTGPFTAYWAVDRPREVGTYHMGKRHGHVVSYYSDGSPQLEGIFEHGEPVGEITHFYEGGAGPAVQQTLVGGQIEGPQKTFDEQGNLRKLSHHRAGEKHGEETRWYPNGRLEHVGLWDSGRPVGLWRSYDESGNQMSEELFVDDGRRKVASLETVFDANGRPTAQTHSRWSEGRWISTATMWHDSGRQAGLVDSVDGDRHGRDITWDDTGRPLIVGTRRDDLRNGTWTFFTRSGEVDRQVRYEAGSEVGGR